MMPPPMKPAAGATRHTAAIQVGNIQRVWLMNGGGANIRS
jgi:hypothetical protein